MVLGSVTWLTITAALPPGSCPISVAGHSPWNATRMGSTGLVRLQPFRCLHDCSGCFRLERLPGGTCTHWKAPPCHGAHPEPTSSALCLRPHCFCGIGVLPVGPIAVTCKITSPSFAHA